MYVFELSGTWEEERKGKGGREDRSSAFTVVESYREEEEEEGLQRLQSASPYAPPRKSGSRSSKKRRRRAEGGREAEAVEGECQNKRLYLPSNGHVLFFLPAFHLRNSVLNTRTTQAPQDTIISHGTSGDQEGVFL